MNRQSATLNADRRRSTGESHQALCGLVESGVPLAIPAAHHVEQAWLEGAVLKEVCSVGGA